jgi:hypothetical protein
MSGVAQVDPIPTSQYPLWAESLRPFHSFLVEHNLHDVPSDNDELATRLAGELRRTILRIWIECELDQESNALLEGAGFLREQPIWTLRTRQSAVVDLISEVRRCFETDPPFSLDAVVLSVHQFVRASEAIPITPQKAKVNSKPTATLPIATELSAVPTPWKFGTKDLISEGETQHSVMDPKLAAELKKALWHTNDDAFFDTYFPRLADDAPQPPKFPHPPTEQAVVHWFRKYHEKFSKYDIEQRDDSWVWQMSPTRPLYHPDNLKRKIDLFITSKPSPSNKRIPDDTDDVDDIDDIDELARARARARARLRWKDVAVVGELKCQQDVGDLNRHIVIQLANYARETFGTQPGRRFVHAFTIINQKMRCWIFTRSGGVSSRSFALNTPEGLNIFCRVFVGYMRMNRHQLGLANFEEKASFGSQMFHLSPKPLWPARGIVTRGTTCWTAEYDNEPDTERPFVVKDSWRFSQRENEAVMLRDCRDANVEGIAEYIGHEESLEVETVHQILGPTLLQAAIPFDLDWKSKKRSSPYVATSASSAKRYKTSTDAAIIANSTSNPLRRSGRFQSKSSMHQLPRHSRRSSTLAGLGTPLSPEPRTYPCSMEAPAVVVPDDDNVDEDEPDAETIAAARASETYIPDRIHTRVVMSRGIRIDECKEYLDVLLAMRDAVRGHRSLLTKGGILHRDISHNNIMIPHHAAPRADHYRGFLIDLDHAQRVSGAPSGAPERTGTYPFLSIEALQGRDGFVHTFYDDLQSFWFVFLLLCTPTEATDLWLSETKVASAVKICLATDETEFETFLGCFTHRVPDNFLLASQTAARMARSALWPHVTRLDRKLLKDPAVRDGMYDGFVKAFDKAVFMIDPESAMFRNEWVDAGSQAQAPVKQV